MSMATTFPELIKRLDIDRVDAFDLPGRVTIATVHYRRALERGAEALGRTLGDFEIHRWALHYSLPRTSIVASRPLAPAPA